MKIPVIPLTALSCLISSGGRCLSMAIVSKTALKAAAVAAAFGLRSVLPLCGRLVAARSDFPVAGVDYVFSLEQTLALYGTTISRHL